MVLDVMTVELLEDFPSLESAIERFVSCTHKALHPPVFFGVRCTLGTLDVVRSLANVSIISLDALKRIKKMSQAIAKDSDVRILTTRKRSVDPDQISLFNINSKLVTKTTFPLELVRGKWVALYSRSLLGNPAVCSVDRQQTVVETPTPLPILEYDLAENNCCELSLRHCAHLHEL